jgi:FkbM family methyltransferase
MTYKEIVKKIKESTILFVKMFLDRRRFRGLDEFKFHWRSAPPHWQAISIEAHDREFKRSVYLRKRTSDLRAFEQVFLDNTYNLRRLARWIDIMHWYSALKEQGSPLILDLGANIGLASVYFASNWPKAFIVPVEPDAGNFSMLTKNTAALNNVNPVRAAIANSEGSVRIVNPEDDAWSIRTELVTEICADTVSAVSVATLLQQRDHDDLACLPFICKIDIEGFEQNLFEKNLDWIAQFPIIIIELHDWMLPGKATSNAFLRAISGHNRDFVYIGENVFSIRNDGIHGASV